MTDNDSRPEDYTFKVNRAAIDTIKAMYAHVEKIGQDWGKDSTEYREASDSLLLNLTTLFGRPIGTETQVFRDGPVSLLLCGLMTIGVIFHGTRRNCLNQHCGAYIEDDGKVWTYSTERAPILDHDHDLSYPLSAAQPGTWSMHS